MQIDYFQTLTYSTNSVILSTVSQVHCRKGQTPHPVDWSDLDEHKGHFLLRAILVSHHRGLCLYEEVHDLSTKVKPKTHCQFLSRLADVLGQQCQPIIVTDAGFKTPWFRAVLAMGWDFVGRARLPNFYSLDNEHWPCITQLYKQATQRPKLLHIKGAGNLNLPAFRA